MKRLSLYFVIWILTSQLLGVVSPVSLQAEGCKTTSSNAAENCASNNNHKDERQSLHNEICKVEHISKDSGDQIKLKDEAGKLCEEENLNFDGIKKQAELILNQETNSDEFEELFPILCETDQNNIQTGVGAVLLKAGYLSAALKHYSNLIEDSESDSCPAWFFMRAMTHEKLGLADDSNVDAALSDYNSALRLVSGEDAAKVYEARAEFFISLARYREAYDDCTAAINIKPSFMLYFRRGISLVFIEKFSQAYDDLHESLRLFPHQSAAMHYLATCLFHLRRVNEAINTFEAVLLIDPQDVRVMLSLSQAYIEVGNFEQAFIHLNKASLLEPTNSRIHQKKAELLYDHGNIDGAMLASRKCVALEPYNQECRMMVAKCHASCGQFYPAIKELTKVTHEVTVRDNNGFHTHSPTMYLREWCRYIHLRFDTPLISFNVEDEIHPGFKENWTKDATCRLYNYTEQPGLQPHVKDLDVIQWEQYSRDVQRLLCYSFNLGRSIHAQGGRYADKLSGNLKAYLASGIAGLEISQTFPHIWKRGAKVGKNKHDMKFSWRDIFDIAIKWIRFVDLDQPLFWVDKIGNRPFKHRFGVIQYNQTRVKYEKYYSKFYHAVAHQCDRVAPPYDESVEPEENFARLIASQENCQNLSDYILVTNKIASKKEGIKNKIDGYLLAMQLDRELKMNLVMEVELSRSKVEAIHEELDFSWMKIIEESKKLSDNIDTNGADHVINWMISLSYYFLNLMPLSHSSTIVSHTVAVGLISAIGRESVGTITSGKDLSLEALTSGEHDKFRSNSRSWLSFRKSSNSANNFENVAQSFPNFRTMMGVMQLDLTTLCKKG